MVREGRGFSIYQSEIFFICIWFDVRCIFIILKHGLNTQNMLVTCVENYLDVSEVKNFAKKHLISS